MIYKLAASFPISYNTGKEIDDIDDLVYIVEEARVNIAELRHAIFHYGMNSLPKILDSVNGKQDMTVKYLKRDIDERLQDAFRKQIRSLNIF